MKVLVIDHFHELLYSSLRTMNLDVHLHADQSSSEILSLKNEYEILVVRSKMRIDEAFLNQFNKVRCIARGGAGMDGIDVEECERRGIHLINAPEGNRDAVAEHTLAMVLAWHTQLVAADNDVKQGNWQREKYRGFELKGKTIGILGFGNTGKEVSRRFQGFGVHIITHDIDSSQYDESLAHAVSSEELKKEADVLCIHIPLLKQNYHLVNSNFISQLKSSTLLVNMSRGEVINTKELLLAIAENRIAGACLDVLENEQKGSFPLLSDECHNLLQVCKEKVIMSPHIGGWTDASFNKIASVIVAKLEDYIQNNGYDTHETMHK